MTHDVQSFKQVLQASLGDTIDTAIILGSGIRAFENLFDGGQLPYQALSEFPAATVAGHAGVLSWGRPASGEPAIFVARGRFHLYEGHGLVDTLRLVEFFFALGVTKLIITNAAGGLRADWRPGDLMLIEDQLNFQGLQAGLSQTFSPVTPFDGAWVERLVKRCQTRGLPLRQGTYVGLLGPSYETMAENHFLIFAGADAVGMSTVPEVARACSHGMRVLGISCITNVSVTPKGAAETSHQEVVDVAKAASELMEQVLFEAIHAA